MHHHVCTEVKDDPLEVASWRPAYSVEYVRIAGELRARIDSGDVPGARPPNSPELAGAWRIGDTYRRLCALLHGEAHRDRVPAWHSWCAVLPVHRLQAHRYPTTQGPTTSPFTRIRASGGPIIGSTSASNESEADAGAPELLPVAGREHAVARHFVFNAGEEPSQMSTSDARWSDVWRKPVGGPLDEPWPGGFQLQLASARIRAVRRDESLTGAIPSPVEAETLRLGRAYRCSGSDAAAHRRGRRLVKSPIRS